MLYQPSITGRGRQNINTTLITSSAYRVQPVEWAIGERLALACSQSVRRAIWKNPARMRAFKNSFYCAARPGLDGRCRAGRPDFAAIRPPS